MAEAITVAVVTGGHRYDVPNFHALFRSFEGLDVYVQHIDDFASSSSEVRQSYDVADSSHPITQGVTSWDMIDETYTMADAGEGSHVLLTCDHARSMRTLAWTRQYGGSRVFCFQNGHDNQTWADPNFRHVLGRGIQWCAGRIGD